MEERVRREEDQIWVGKDGNYHEGTTNENVGLCINLYEL